MEGMLNNDLDTRAGWPVVGGQSAVKQPRATSTALSLHRLISRGVSLHLETHLISSASEHSFLFLPSTHLNFEGKVVAVRSQAR